MLISLLFLAALIAWLIISQPDTADTTIHPPIRPVTPTAPVRPVDSPWYGDRN